MRGRNRVGPLSALLRIFVPMAYSDRSCAMVQTFVTRGVFDPGKVGISVESENLGFFVVHPNDHMVWVCHLTSVLSEREIWEWSRAPTHLR